MSYCICTFLFVTGAKGVYVFMCADVLCYSSRRILLVMSSCEWTGFNFFYFVLSMLGIRQDVYVDVKCRRIPSSVVEGILCTL